VDALAGYGVPTLDSTRNIAYAGPPAVDQTATGETRLHDLWTGISVGRPFDWGAFDVTPEGSLNYHEVRLDSFSETMSNPNGPGSGLGLTYGDASIPSLQGRAGLRTAYTWSTSWGVFAPNVHAAFIREFRNYPDTFTVKFENAPAGSTLGSVLQTDPPEGHYTGYGAGLSFQLAHSISGFFDYEELRTLKTIQSHEFSFGIRYQVGL
jgi:outer membrane autotransporter protein